LQGIIHPVDLLVLTYDEFMKRVEDHSYLYHTIHDEGVLLYEAP
jgi:hypothetical protein